MSAGLALKRGRGVDAVGADIGASVIRRTVIPRSMNVGRAATTADRVGSSSGRVPDFDAGKAIESLHVRCDHDPAGRQCSGGWTVLIEIRPTKALYLVRGGAAGLHRWSADE